MNQPISHEPDRSGRRGRWEAPVWASPAGEQKTKQLEQLAEFTGRLTMLSDDGVEKIYQTAYQECQFETGNVPPAVAMQQLVACWRVLRKFRAAGR